MNDLENFRAWFKQPMADLNEMPHGGFAVLLIAFPVLERYVREKSGVGGEMLNDPARKTAFYDAVHTVLSDCLARQDVEQFWQCYRNGLCHQATFSTKVKGGGTTLINVAISGSSPLVEFDPNDNCFYVNPRLFSERVASTIEADFANFLGTPTTNYQFSNISQSTGTSFIPQGASVTGTLPPGPGTP